MAVTHPKIGLLGGSFDPVHIAHIALADTAYHSLMLDQVQLIPAGDPWQRAPLSASAKHRVAMLERAAAGRLWLDINTTEIERNGPTYTIDTLKALPDGPDYYWILGTDQLSNFCTWRAWRDIALRVQLVAAERPGSAPAVPDALAQFLQETGRSIIFMDFAPHPVSATRIRQELREGNHAPDGLSPDVAAYIRKHGLYEGDAPPQLTV